MSEATTGMIAVELARRWLVRYGRMPRPFDVEVIDHGIQRLVYKDLPAAPALRLKVPGYVCYLPWKVVLDALERIIDAHAAEAPYSPGAAVASGRERLTC